MNTETLEFDQYTDEQLEAALEARQAKKAAEQSQKRKAYEALREDTIVCACEAALDYHKALKFFKSKVFADSETLYTLLQEYSNRHTDGDGNFGVESKDGRFKLSYSRQKLGFFDERSVQGTAHIMDFVNRQFSGDPATRKLITLALEKTDGKLDIKQVQKLYTMENDYDDFNWKEGIKLLKESWTPSESKDYIRFYQKVKGEYKLINLNFASIK
jgi:hypothetical protein